MITTQILDDPRIPDNWRREIIAGSEFGQKALRAIEKLRLIGYPGANSPPQPTAVSAVGTQLRQIIEGEIGRKLRCVDCLGYLLGLNRQSTHDHAAIVAHLSAQFPWPIEWRERNTRRRATISSLIAPVVPPPKGLTYD